MIRTTGAVQIVTKSLFITITTMLFSLITGCSAPESEKMENVNPLEWGAAERVSVVIKNEDTISKRDLFVVIRANQSFSQSQLPLIITTESPDGVLFEESCILRSIKPTNTLATIWEAQIPYRVNIVLGSRGSYRFSFSPSDGVVEGITAIGIKILPVDR